MKTIIRPYQGMPLIQLGNNVVGVATDHGIEFDADPQTVAEAAAIADRQDVIKALAHGGRAETGEPVTIKFTPQGVPVECAKDRDAEFALCLDETIAEPLESVQSEAEVTVADAPDITESKADTKPAKAEKAKASDK